MVLCKRSRDVWSGERAAEDYGGAEVGFAQSEVLDEGPVRWLMGNLL